MGTQGLDANGRPRRWRQDVMGTVVSFAVACGAGDERRAEEAVDRAQGELRRADDVFSTWKPDSPMSRLRRGELDLAEAPPEIGEVLALCRRLREASDGWFDPWSLPGGVDPTGLVKGWAVERAMDELRSADVRGAMINAGGDIAVIGRPAPGDAWRIGIRDPLRPDRLVLTVELAAGGAVATSGAYEREEHVRTPDGSARAGGILSATVLGLDLGVADALATALFASGGELLPSLGRQPGYHGIIVDARGVPRPSDGLRTALPHWWDAA